MNGLSIQADLVDEWARYLRRHGHSLRKARCDPPVLLSVNGRGTRYRWLFFLAQGSSLQLWPAAREHIQRQLRTGHRARQQTYAVIKFNRPAERVLVLPAATVLLARQVRYDRGGISWGWGAFLGPG